VEVDDPFPFGAARPRPFLVNVEPGRQAPIQLRATMNQRPLFPGWVPPVAGIAAAAIALAAVGFVAGVGPFAPDATPSPSLVAEATSPPPSLGPGGGSASAGCRRRRRRRPSSAVDRGASASPTPAPLSRATSRWR
jgi:hypothetical protein